MLSEYSIVLRYSARPRVTFDHTSSGDGPCACGPNTEPSPRPFQSRSVGTGVHGEWLEISSISAITGACGAARSLRWNVAMENWSGIGA